MQVSLGSIDACRRPTPARICPHGRRACATHGTDIAKRPLEPRLSVYRRIAVRAAIRGGPMPARAPETRPDAALADPQVPEHRSPDHAPATTKGGDTSAGLLGQLTTFVAQVAK